MRRTVVRMLMIVLGSAAVALAVNTVRTDIDEHGDPRQLPLKTLAKRVVDPDTEIALDDAEQMWSGGLAVFLDARSPADYADGHIALAHSLPDQMFEETYPAIADLLSRSGPIIVYCDGVECELSHAVAERLTKLGYENVRILVNGWTLWRQASLPTASGAQP